MLEEILKIYSLVHLLKEYRKLALNEHQGNTHKCDEYSYFHKEMRTLDTIAKDVGIPGIIPKNGACDRND
jgi:hypothetical protein